MTPPRSRSATHSSCPASSARPFSPIHERLPSRTARPSTEHWSPWPAAATKSTAPPWARRAPRAVIAFAIGCSEPRSAEPAARSSASSARSAAHTATDATASLPLVSVRLVEEHGVDGGGRSNTSPP